MFCAFYFIFVIGSLIHILKTQEQVKGLDDMNTMKNK